MVPDLYLECVQEDDGIKIVPVSWVRRVVGSGLLNLLRMPHLIHYNVRNCLVRQFLALVHDGCFWIKDRIPIDVVLIHRIIGLPMEGPNPLECIGKKYEGKTVKYVQQKYHVEKNIHSFMIKTISYPTTQLGTMLLACKMM